MSVKKTADGITRRSYLKRAALASAVGLGGYAFGIEPRWVSVEHSQLSIPGLPPALENKTAVQLSDLHIGTGVGDNYLRTQFEYVASLEPDFVFFTGDYLDCGTDWHVQKGIALLPEFPRGKLGTACVLGNHDYGRSAGEARHNRENTQHLIDRFRQDDLNLLLDDSVEMSGLHVVGLRDLWHGSFELESAALAIEKVSGKPSIVLSHNPDTVDLPIWDSYRSWVLSGHTHGGQCRFPLIGAPILPVNNKRYVAGAYDIAGGHRLYINRGLGHTYRVRFMSRPEISVFQLTSASS